MSDAFSDLEKQKRDEVERWRKLAKEQFVSELTTKEMVDELSKREGVHHITVHPYDDVIILKSSPNSDPHSMYKNTGPARILVVTD